jgi:hypothetical protein
MAPSKIDRLNFENSQFMFQICVPNQKVQRKVAMHYIPKILKKFND